MKDWEMNEVGPTYFIMEMGMVNGLRVHSLIITSVLTCLSPSVKLIIHFSPPTAWQLLKYMNPSYCSPPSSSNFTNERWT